MDRSIDESTVLPQHTYISRSNSKATHNSIPILSSTWFLIIVVVGLLMTAISRSILQTCNDDVSNMISNRKLSHDEVNSVEERIRLLLVDVSDMDDDKSARSGRNEQPLIEEVQSLQGKVKKLNERADSMKHYMQEMSKVDVIKKYGPGPHRVKIELNFPGDSSNLKGHDSFVIEMAPLDLMPHSVYIFLEMVSKGLVDDSSFVLNALHALKTAPVPSNGGSAAAKARAFRKYGLDGVGFREYNESYPHKKNTVGFAADGSPSFYINTHDNTELHEGDPCFGKIVEGFDAVQRIQNSPTRNGIWFDKKVGIIRAYVI